MSEHLANRVPYSQARRGTRTCCPIASQRDRMRTKRDKNVNQSNRQGKKLIFSRTRLRLDGKIQHSGGQMGTGDSDVEGHLQIIQLRGCCHTQPKPVGFFLPFFLHPTTDRHAAYFWMTLLQKLDWHDIHCLVLLITFTSLLTLSRRLKFTSVPPLLSISAFWLYLQAHHLPWNLPGQPLLVLRRVALVRHVLEITFELIITPDALGGDIIHNR